MTPIGRVKKARLAKVKAEAALVAAIRDARAAGETLQAIGDACGMTRAGVLWHLQQTPNSRP